MMRKPLPSSSFTISCGTPSSSRMTCITSACQNHGHIHFLFRSHRVDRLVQRLFEDGFVQKHQGIHGLILRGGSHSLIDGQVSEKGLDLLFALCQIVREFR
jgi:hypothetical protein